MNAPKKSPTDPFNIGPVRIHWPRPREFKMGTNFKTGEPEEKKPNVQMMLDKETDAALIEQLTKRAHAVCRLKNPEKETKGPFEGQGKLVAPGDLGLIDGDFVKGDEWDGKFRITCSVQQLKGEPPRVARIISPFDPSKEIDMEEPTGLYAGCFANLRIDAWFNTMGNNVAFGLIAIQFAADGERLVGGVVNEATEDMGFGVTQKPQLAADEDWDNDAPKAGGKPTPAADEGWGDEDDISF